MSGRLLLAASFGFALAGSAAYAAEKCQISQVVLLPVTVTGMRPTAPVKINGEDAVFLADSGAFYSFMTPEAVERFKLPTAMAPPGFTVRGVGGDTRAFVATVKEFGLPGAVIRNVQFLVTRGLGGGVAGALGQNVLAAFDTEYDLGNGIIRLMRPSGACGRANPAYWAGAKAVSMVEVAATTPLESQIRGEAKLNGQTIRVVFDTGAATSVLKRSTAERLGFRPEGPGVVRAGESHGIGPRVAESFAAPFQSFEVGGEQINNTRLRVADIILGNSDMLLGADFFLSHRVYYARQQHRLYFTYNGGPVFRLEEPKAAGIKTTDVPLAPSQDGAEYADAPRDAAGFSRRGSAFLSRRDYAHALDDFGRAIELEPKEPHHYADRGAAHLAAGHPVLAMADFDQALTLKPDDARALIGRGALYLAGKDLTRAQADLDAALKAAPPDSSVALEVGSLYAQAGMFPRALAAYDGWIATHPSDERLAMALNGRCWTRTLSGKDLPLALADCDAALKRGGRSAAILDSRGLVLLRMGRYDDAVNAYDQALKLQPKLPWSLYGRGLAKTARGQTAEGEADIQGAAALAPTLPEQAKRYGIEPPGGVKASPAPPAAKALQ